MNRCAGITACSDPLKLERIPQINELCDVLERMGVRTVRSPYIFSDDGSLPFSAEERADALMNFYADPSVDRIFDVSGGDLANEILDRLDYDLIAGNPKPFWGYSDLTCILNAIYAKCGLAGVLYRVRNLTGPDRVEQQMRFAASLLNGDDAGGISDFDYTFLQGDRAEGIVIGGNIRCFLKLAGTEYMPDLCGKILVLEGYSGGVHQMVNYVSHLRQLGAFEKVSGILLGTYTQMERDGQEEMAAEIILRNVPSTLPVMCTRRIGHGTDSLAIQIGKHRVFEAYRPS